MKKFVLSILLLLSVASIFACTSVIISGNRTESGIPLMIKNRDTDCLDNRLQWFQVGDVSFIGLVNAPVDSGEVWAGTNSLGLSIMNTATYNFYEDSITAVYNNELYWLEQDTLLHAAQLSKRRTDSLNLKKEKDQIYADTLRVHYAAEMAELRSMLAYERHAMDSIQQARDMWLYTVKIDPSLSPRPDVVDMEGQVMFKALATCATVSDFLNLLDTLPKPIGIETNFGVIDKQGGAVYVEANNWRYVVYDVNQEPMGYRVQTNFAFAGRVEEYKGYERYLTAEAAMKDLSDHFTRQPIGINHSWLFNHLSRSYRHEILGYPEGFCPHSGILVDQDFIPRRSTSASVVFEGPVMWTLLGYPACGVAMPAMVLDRDRLPAEMKRTAQDSTAVLSNQAMQIKMNYVFPTPYSNGRYYVNIGTVMNGQPKKPSLLSCCNKAEDQINKQFYSLYNKWQRGKMSDKQFYAQYESLLERFPAIYNRNFRKYLEPANK